MHLGEPFKVAYTGKVGEHMVAMPHLGVVLERADWEMLAGKLTDAGVEFIIPPTARFVGEVGEQHTMFFTDPSGNPIEIKGFKNFDMVFDS